jgi:hypothetical protein
MIKLKKKFSTFLLKLTRHYDCKGVIEGDLFFIVLHLLLQIPPLKG